GEIGVRTKALLRAVEAVAGTARAIGQGARVGVGIIASDSPAPVAEHAIDAGGARPVLRAALAAQRVARPAQIRAEQAQTVGLVEAQAHRRFGDLVDVAHQRAVDDILIARR